MVCEYAYCDSCKHCDIEAHLEPCVSCKITYTGAPTKWKSQNKQQTNADRIRAMSDEEQEAFLVDVDLEKVGSPFITEWGKWLKQPAE